MPSPPRVSIIIPVYNAEAYLDACIGSITDQSFSPVEIIMVDDGSRDDSVAVIEKHRLQDSRIRLLQQDKNGGAPRARNRGMSMAKGDYVMFMDADDMLAEDCLEQLVRTADECGSDAVKGTMQVDDGNSRATHPHGLNQKSAFTNTNLSSCPDIQHLYQYQTYLFRLSVIRSAGIEFDTDLRNFQDPTFLARLLPECRRIDVVMIPVYIRTVRANSIITSDWKLDNYLSLVNGVTRAYANLLEKGQEATAEAMAKTFSRWWRKLELMPRLLQVSECMQVYSGIEHFSRDCRHSLCEFSWPRVGAYHCLKLISSGRLEEAHQKMRNRMRLLQRPALLLLKLYDIAVYGHARLVGKI